jgi:hypothetical protein
MGERRLFALRVIKSSWGIEIDVEAKAHVGSPPPRDALRAGSRTWLYVLDPLDREYRQALLDGLRQVAADIEQAVPDAMVVVEVQGLDYSPADCPAEAFTAAMIGWAADEYGLGEPAYTVGFDEAANSYVFTF